MTSELSKRVVTGLLGAAALILIMVFGGWIGVCILTAALSLGMAYEYSKMVFQLEDQGEKKYLLLFLTWITTLMNLILPRTELEILLFSFLFLFIWFLVTAKKWSASPLIKSHFLEMGAAFFGVMYVIILPLYLTRIHEVLNGVYWALTFFLIVWAGDTGAYFVGKKYGKTRLYEAMSPKKTREGAWGGLASGVIVVLLYKLLFFRALPWSGVFIVPCLVGAVAQVGDLCESFLKRAWGVKDSGSILPGHGGFLDRFDGVVFSLPVMYACVRIFG